MMAGWGIRAATGLAFALAAIVPSAAQDPIKIGEMNSYKAIPAFLEPYSKGMELAVEEVNAAGGVLGRPLEVVARDDGANPGDAVRTAEELVAREGVDLLAGTFLSNVGLAVAEYAKQRKVFFLASEPLSDKLTWENGNRYTFRLRPSTYMQVAMLMDAVEASGAKRWALVYPNYEYGTSAAETFKQLLKERVPDAEIVTEQAPPLRKIDAGAVVQALADSRPDGIFNALFAGDLAQFVREGQTRGLFDEMAVVSLITGEPEYLNPLGGDTPTGWAVTGYPWYGIDTPEHDAFLSAYQEMFDDNPYLGSVVGYSTIKAIAAGIEKAGTTDTEALVDAFKGLTVETPFGDVTFREIDHQSTMGAYVGSLDLVDGEGRMVDFRYVSGEEVMPSDEMVRELRPAD
ncbi:branched-chain amino acid transport system substrate-binding protein [Amorphus orientalis]|uniref:Branched-chain amino acid transport system substrate-binding protein n=2 Tax=Amorphus orientalis TaxID=649198 RepID=A0AAE3VQQ1_9HYPH|nr:ABC transporter substrate-binding protein [Amorphus orientalis]MDQ0316011.1 branched-chain amino acid transport system substrate-binding protein [Amorphus orientalis]